MNLDLKNKKWNEFLIGDLFNVKTGSLVPKRKLAKGSIARITATDSNNGVFDYYAEIDHKNFRVNENFISISFLGSVFYHPYKASLDMKIHSVKLKGKKFNKYLAFFLVLALKRTTEPYSYGNQLSSSDLPKRKILLPTNSKGEPDFEFMEAFMRYKEQEKLIEYKNYINQRLKALENFKKVKPIEEKEWAEFFIDDVVEILSGRDIYGSERIRGNIPYISATSNNNGISHFVGNDNQTKESGCLSVNRNGSVGYSFYHPYEALFSNDCRKLRLKKSNKYIGIFISQQITRQRGKYGYGYKMGTARLKRQKILLPVNDQNEPDYDYMENYMKQLEYKKLNEYLENKIT